MKEKILKIAPNRWWGDDYDVRFVLLSKLNEIQRKIILDMGGGVGIILWNLDQSNLKINIDTSISDLRICKTEFPEIQTICASNNHIPFRNESCDVIICANLLEVAKIIDIENNSQVNKKVVTEYPSIENILKEIKNNLKKNGEYYITTPNNEYYKGKKLDYYELKHSLTNHFKNFRLFFFNTYPSNRKHSKLNMANIIPKIRGKFIEQNKIIFSLLKKDEGKNKKSVSFFIEGEKE